MLDKNIKFNKNPGKYVYNKHKYQHKSWKDKAKENEKIKDKSVY